MRIKPFGILVIGSNGVRIRRDASEHQMGAAMIPQDLTDLGNGVFMDANGHIVQVSGSESHGGNMAVMNNNANVVHQGNMKMGKSSSGMMNAIPSSWTDLGNGLYLDENGNQVQVSVGTVNSGHGNMVGTTTTMGGHGNMGGTTTTKGPEVVDLAAVIADLKLNGWIEAPNCAPDHYPHPTDCQKFYQCDHGYRSPDRFCSAGTLYHHAIKACDHAADTVCETSDTLPGALGGPCNSENDASLNFSAHQDKCGSYLICDQGLWVNGDCPIGQYFDVETSTCDIISNVDCGSRASHLSNIHEMSNYFIAETADWENYACAGEGLFDCAVPIHGKQLDEFDRDFFNWKKCIQCTMSGASNSVWQNPSAVIHPKRQPPEYIFLIDHLQCYGEDEEDGTPNVAKTICECDWRLVQSLRGQTPDERYKNYQFNNCVKATGHFESECCYHNGLYDVFNAAVSCCGENGHQPKGTCGTHDSSDL